jgi:hypothetical protein
MSCRFRLAGALLLALVLLMACRTQPDAAVDSTPSGGALSSAVKISVSRTGLYRVPAAQLSAAGLPQEHLRPEQLALFLGDLAIPFWVEGPALYFYGQAPADRYTSVTTYVLRWSQAGGAGSVMGRQELPAAAGPPLSSVSQTRRLEQNRLYVSRAASAVSEPWFWERLAPGLAVELPFSLPTALPDDGEVRIAFWGLTSDSSVNPDHRVALALNNEPLGLVEWDGEMAMTATLPIPARVLQEGENRLTATVPGGTGNDIDLSYLDWFEIDHRTPVQLGDDGMLALPEVSGDLLVDEAAFLFDVTDPIAPLLLTAPAPADGGPGFHMAQPRSLVALSREGGLLPAAVVPLQTVDRFATTHGADYLIIAPAELIPGLEPLAAARRQQGLSVAVTPLEEIYDEFGAGSQTPLAIGAFLRYASQEWPLPHPRFLLLVGDATYDFRDYLGLAPAYALPPLLVSASHSGETVSDARLADLDDDGRPDLAVGRWPVASPEAVTALVERTLAYEAADETSSRSLFAVDDSEPSFAGMSDRLVQAAGLEESAQTLQGVSADEVVDAWNGGAWLVNYVGHGSLNLWGKNELLGQAALARLAANHRPPIVVHLTCLSGYFAHPVQSSLAEEMLWHPSGPVAVIAATSLTLSSYQEPFATALLEALADPNVLTVGDALLRAQQTPGIDQEVVDTFSLLGDPALIISRPD